MSMASYSGKYDKYTLSTLKNKLEQAGAKFMQPQYTEFQVRLNGVVATFYTSGKLVVQGANIENFLEEYLNIQQSPKTYANQATLALSLDEKPYPHIGVDESGKGDFFGPLCVAGVLLDEKQAKYLKELGIKDSKKLDDKKILTLAQEVKKNSIYNTIHITPKKYNELYDKFKNLNKMLAWGHSTVIENVLAQKNADFAICDKFGDEKFILSALKEKGRQIQIIQETKAEADTAVAAASILARAEYVNQMGKLCSYYEMNFPKGASDKVIQAGHEFVSKFGIQEMRSVCKAHFKTYQEFI